MTIRHLLLLSYLLISSISYAQPADLKAGMKITRSMQIRRAVYALNGSNDVQTPVIEISGNDIVVDFNQAELRGSNDKQMPDEYYGLAVLIKGGKNITIKNLNARGYKVAVMARDVEGLTIENCNLSYNYRQHLNSTQEKEDISDWMSYHQNEKDEWLRYGAAIYLRNCYRATITKNIVTGGQCALMLTQCTYGLISNNNFSFNSAIGIGMYRSSDNRIQFNKLDWNVRGHSEGVYNRGQDSAAILVFEQCNNNFFLQNSATHSGDGFFLWAGQTTMDTGKGGCNGNYVYGNDFSHAPTNGIEVTFSSNMIVNNRVEECDHGIWGGYSFNTEISRNKFTRNRIAIAIEHGQDNDIFGNTFERNKESIRLWARKEQPKDWGYARERDTRSRDYRIQANRIAGDSIVYNFNNTTGVRLTGNRKQGHRIVYKLDPTTAAAIDTTEESVMLDAVSGLDEGRRGEYLAAVMLPEDHPRGRQQIRITEWGPYDFRYPLLWRTNPLDTSGLLKFEVVGPAGQWKVVGSKGVEGISKTSGTLPDTITARKLRNYKGEILIEMEFRGGEVTTQFGLKPMGGAPFRFAFRDARVPMQWKVKWFGWDSTANPVTHPDKWSALTRQSPVLEQTGRSLEYAWWGGLNVQGQRTEKFITEASTAVDVLPGEYELAVTWDDAVRVYQDGKLILNEWNPSIYKFDESPNRRIKLTLRGKHTFRVEHVELGGFATLSVKLKKL